MKSTRHGNELLGMGIQSATKRGDSGNDNLAYSSGDDTRLGIDQTKADVFEPSNDMSVGNSIGENQIESDSDLENDLFSLAKDDNDVFSDSDDGAYLLADESLEGTLDASFKSFPCTDVSAQTQHKNVGSRSVPELDPGADLLSSRVPDPSDKWEEIDDFGFFVFLMKCFWSLVTMKSFYPAPLILLVLLLMQLTMLTIFTYLP